MTAFPENIRFSYPVLLDGEWNTLISDMDGGQEQRRKKRLFAVYNARLKATRLSATDMQAVWDFYQARHGAYEAFHFFEPGPSYGITTSWKDLYVGVRNGTTTTYDLPGKSTSSQAIYINGALQSSGYSILTGGGTDGADRVQFTGGGTLGDVATCDFTGSLRIRCRFREDKLTRELFVRKLFQVGIDLKGLGPA